MKYIIIICFSICLGFMLLPHGHAIAAVPAGKDTVELTDTDFTQVPWFNGNHATVFGLKLGMGRNGAKALLAARHPEFKLQEDPFNPGERYYLVDYSDEKEHPTIAYLKWPKYDSGLYQIVVYPAMKKYMKGVGATIVTPGCVDPYAEIYKFLGEPTGKQVLTDKPALHMKTSMLYYPKWGVAIEEDVTADGRQYNLVLTRKW